MTEELALEMVNKGKLKRICKSERTNLCTEEDGEEQKEREVREELVMVIVIQKESDHTD